jgi:hypothetical protein
MARPSKFTPIKAAKIIEGLKAGMTRTAAAGLVNIDVATLENWRRRYSSFLAQIDIAEQEAEARYIGVIAKAAFGHEVTERKETHKANGEIEVIITTRRDYDWQAARYWLSRRRRDEWGDRVEIELTREIETLLGELTLHATATDTLPTTVH